MWGISQLHSLSEGERSVNASLTFLSFLAAPSYLLAADQPSKLGTPRNRVTPQISIRFLTPPKDQGAYV